MNKDRLIQWGKLVSWRQRRCIRCQKFLAKREFKYCDKCRILVRHKSSKRYRIKLKFGKEGWMRLIKK